MCSLHFLGLNYLGQALLKDCSHVCWPQSLRLGLRIGPLGRDPYCRGLLLRRLLLLRRRLVERLAALLIVDLHGLPMSPSSVAAAWRRRIGFRDLCLRWPLLLFLLLLGRGRCCHVLRVDAPCRIGPRRRVSSISVVEALHCSGLPRR